MSILWIDDSNLRSPRSPSSHSDTNKTSKLDANHHVMIVRPPTTVDGRHPPPILVAYRAEFFLPSTLNICYGCANVVQGSDQQSCRLVHGFTPRPRCPSVIETSNVVSYPLFHILMFLLKSNATLTQFVPRLCTRTSRHPLSLGTELYLNTR